MPGDLKIFVVDTGPLITLAAAQSLDYLFYVNADLIIPDAVLHEATFDAGRLGAQDVIAWVKAHRASIEIAPTRAYQVFDAARANIPGLREPDLGERAAVEVIEEPDRKPTANGDAPRGVLAAALSCPYQHGLIAPAGSLRRVTRTLNLRTDCG